MAKRGVIIADDEPNAREHLARLLEEDDKVELLGTFRNGLEVLRFCETMTPDIILLDIEMPGMDGLETARKLTNKNRNCTIIFITAYNQYAIEAFNLMAIGYLLKPFTKEELINVIDRAQQLLELKDKVQFSERIEKLWERLNNHKGPFLKEITIKDRGLEINIPTNEIIYIKSESEYIKIRTKNGNHLRRQSLAMILAQLPGSFKQIHRSYIINSVKIKKWKYLNNGKYSFLFENEEEIDSSRSFKSSIQKWIQE